MKLEGGPLYSAAALIPVNIILVRTQEEPVSRDDFATKICCGSTSLCAQCPWQWVTTMSSTTRLTARLLTRSTTKTSPYTVCLRVWNICGGTNVTNSKVHCERIFLVMIRRMYSLLSHRCRPAWSHLVHSDSSQRDCLSWTGA